jgi:hypothetical protein
MTQSKLKWRVQPAPTGRYRSFERRGWPEAQIDGVIVAMLEAPENYSTRVLETTELRVRVTDRSKAGPFAWRTLKARPIGVTAAKALVGAFFAAHPEWLGGE